MEELVTLTIDGREVSVPQGTTVLDAAQKLGIVIPTFCYYVKLSRIGACRMCLVEIEKVRGLQTACTTTVRPGMAVHTDTPEVIKARQGNLEFLLTNHPLDCPVCDKGGECTLQDYVFKYGRTTTRFIEEKRRKRKAHPLGPFIIKDDERCVLCRRCIRFLDEWADEPQLEVFERGRISVVDTFPGHVLDSKFSGNIIELCPVGALTSRLFRFQARTWELKNVPSICPHCGVGCNIYLGVKAGRLRRITSRENPYVNEEWLCDKGRFAYKFIESAERLNQPLIRKNGELTPVSWEEALNTVAQRLQEIIAHDGPQSIGGIGSARTTNEANYLFQRFLRAVVGTNNIDYIGRPPEDVRPFIPLPEIEKADVLFLIGVNPSERAPIVELFLNEAARRYGAELIVADPRRIKLARSAQWLAVRPGAEVALLNGLAHLIIARKEKVGATLPGMENLKEWVAEFTPEKAAEWSGVSEEALVQAARAMSEARNPLSFYGPSIAKDRPKRAALVNLARLIGSGEPYHLACDNNALGALDMGIAPHLLPGRQILEDKAVREKFGQLWGKELPKTLGLSLEEMLKALEEGKLKALYVMGSDPATACCLGSPTLEKLEFLIVQDIFPTETARLADVVLPAASFAEIEGTYTNINGRVQLLRPALKSPDQARPDWEIISNLARAMGQDFGEISPEKVMEEIATLAPMYAEITYQALGEGGLLRRWPEPEEWAFAEVKFTPPPIYKKYPLALVTGRTLYDRGVLISRSEIMKKLIPEAYIEINSADAEELSLAEGDRVKVISARGSLELKAKITPAIRQGCVFVPMYLSETPVDVLFGEEAGIIHVRLEKA